MHELASRSATRQWYHKVFGTNYNIVERMLRTNDLFKQAKDRVRFYTNTACLTVDVCRQREHHAICQNFIKTQKTTIPTRYASCEQLENGQGEFVTNYCSVGQVINGGSGVCAVTRLPNQMEAERACLP